MNEIVPKIRIKVVGSTNKAAAAIGIPGII